MVPDKYIPQFLGNGLGYKFIPRAELMICNMYNDNMGLRKVGEQFGVSRTTIQTVLKNNNVVITPYRVFSLDDKVKICDLYKDGIPVTQIVRLYKAKFSKIKEILLDSGMVLELSNHKLFSVSNQQRIHEMYDEGVPVYIIAKRFKAAFQTINRFLQNRGLPKRLLSSVNHDAFDEITPETAYWIGFLVADGCIFRLKGSYCIQLHLSIKDLDHLEKFREFIGTSNVITHPNGKGIDGNIVVKSEKVFKRLCEFGIMPRKSGREQIIGLGTNRHFWRGWVDGDGSLGIYRYPALSVCGSLRIVTQFQDFVRDFIPKYKVAIYSSNSPNFFTSRVGGKQAQKMVKILYEDCETYLQRKYVIAKRIMDYKYSKVA